MCALSLVVVATVNFLAISVVWGASDSLYGSDATGPECYYCVQEYESTAKCNAEQPPLGTDTLDKCRGGDYCSIRYFFDGAIGSNGAYVSRLCIARDRFPQIHFTTDVPLYCASVFGQPAFFDCICEGKGCNWFPISSVYIAYGNIGKSPRDKIPPRTITGSSSSGSGSVQSRPMGLSGSGGSAGSISKPGALSGSGGAGVPVNPSGSAGTGGSSSPGSLSGSGGSGRPAPSSGSGGGASGTGGGSGSGSSGTGTGSGIGNSGSGVGSGSGEGGSGGVADGETLGKIGEGSASGASSLDKGGTGAGGSGQGTMGNGTDAAAAQGSGSSMGLIAGIIGGVVSMILRRVLLFGRCWTDVLLMQVAVSAMGGALFYWHKKKEAKKREDEEGEGEDDEEP